MEPKNIVCRKCCARISADCTKRAED
jgi:alkylhydroperoxidase/carboxymuconolactone decarboxylase family protein YurZ